MTLDVEIMLPLFFGRPRAHARVQHLALSTSAPRSCSLFAPPFHVYVIYAYVKLLYVFHSYTCTRFHAYVTFVRRPLS